MHMGEPILASSALILSVLRWDHDYGLNELALLI